MKRPIVIAAIVLLIATLTGHAKAAFSLSVTVGDDADPVLGSGTITYTVTLDLSEARSVLVRQETPPQGSLPQVSATPDWTCQTVPIDVTECFNPNISGVHSLAFQIALKPPGAPGIEYSVLDTVKVFFDAADTVRDATWQGSITVTESTQVHPDDDTDGVDDEVDACLFQHGSPPSGCPIAARTLKLRYRHGAFTGVLDSPTSQCVDTQDVTVIRSKKGTKSPVGVDATDGVGKFSLVSTRHKGNYRATADGVVIPDVAACEPVRSAKLVLS